MKFWMYLYEGSDWPSGGYQKSSELWTRDDGLQGGWMPDGWSGGQEPGLVQIVADGEWDLSTYVKRSYYVIGEGWHADLRAYVIDPVTSKDTGLAYGGCSPNTRNPSQEWDSRDGDLKAILSEYGWARR